MLPINFPPSALQFSPKINPPINQQMPYATPTHFRSNCFAAGVHM